MTALVATLVPPGVADVSAAQMVGEWKLDEGSGATAGDSSGRAHDGAISGAAYTPLTAPVDGSGSSLRFDGADDEVRVADHADFDFASTDAMTLSMWFRKVSAPTIYHLLGKRSESTGAMNYQLARDAGGIHFNSDGGRVNTSVSDVPAGVWTHLSAVYDGTTLRVYLNGTEVGSAPYALGAPNDATLGIGASSAAVGDRFPGSIDNVAIWRRALSATEIAELSAVNRWSPEAEFRLPPDMANPSPDRFGNSAVWTYLEGPISAGPRDPTTYTALVQDPQPAWRSPTPSIGAPVIRLSDESLSPALLAHPETNRYVVIGWNAPESGSAVVSGVISDGDAGCGDGVRWYIDKGGANLVTGAFGNGSSQTVSASTSVVAGDQLYVVLDPGAASDFYCDTTVIDLFIDLAVSPPPTTTTTSSTTTTTTIPPPAGEGVLEFSAPTYGGSENGEAATLHVVRSGGTTGTVAVNYTTSDGTARAEIRRFKTATLPKGLVPDYTVASGTLVFADGEVDKTIAVPVIDDAAIEDEETFNMTLRDPANGAELGPRATAIIAIADNDPSVSFTRSTSSKGEGDGVARIDVSLSVPSETVATVDYTVTGGTATVGSDHAPVNGTLRFGRGRDGQPSVKESIFVRLVDDERREFAETLQIQLSNPTNSHLGSIGTHTLTIEDDDPNGDLAGNTPATALRLDLVTQPRQLIREHLDRAGGATDVDVYRLHLDAGDALGIDVDGMARTQADRLASSTLTILGADGTTELARVGRSQEPDTGAFTTNPAHLFRAATAGDIFVRLETSDAGRWNGYQIELHRIALSEGHIDPALLDEPGTMYAWLDDGVLGITGPTGYGFGLEGNWTTSRTFEARTGRWTTTYRLAAGRRVTLHTALGQISANAIEPIRIPTSPSTWGQVVGAVTDESIRFRVGIALDHWTEQLNGLFGYTFQQLAGADLDTWYIELGKTTTNRLGIKQVLRGVPYLRSSDRPMASFDIAFGKLEFHHEPAAGKPAIVIVEPTDPSFFIQKRKDETIVLAFSVQGHIPFHPLLPPTDPTAIGLTDFYAHTYYVGGGKTTVAGLPLEVLGSRSDDLDANDDGTELAGQGNADDLASGDLSAIGDMLRDFNAGIDAQVDLHFERFPFDFQMTLGRASLVYNGLEGAVWLRARTGGQQPFAGTPLSFLKAGDADEVEGVLYLDGRVSVTAQTSLPVPGPGDLDFLVHLDNDGIDAEVEGSVQFEGSAHIDNVGSASCTANAHARGALSLTYSSGIRMSGSLRAKGSVKCFAGGEQVASAAFDVGASVSGNTLTVKLPYIGNKSISL